MRRTKQKATANAVAFLKRPANGNGRQQLALRPLWLRGRDLNPRPLGYEPNELPDCSTPRQRNLIVTLAAGAPQAFERYNRKSLRSSSNSTPDVSWSDTHERRPEQLTGSDLSFSTANSSRDTSGAR